MLATIFSPTAFVFIAGALYTLGYLFINQMVLRILVMAGSLSYLAYYYTAADTPLWDAIAITLVLMTANAIGMANLMLRNARFTVPRGYDDIYPDFQPLLPGDFRQLMRLAKRRTLSQETVLTREGASLGSIYYVVSGMPVVTKMGTSFPMAERIFVGEVAYLTGKGSAATTTVPAGAEVLEWKLDRLTEAARRKPQIKLALDAVISRDLARKVALAVAPAAQQIGREQAS